ncbi:dienelactone hydrolase family protein [Micromonospora sp. LAH09]|uniref:dienelactone hydrolase family protein n=1 Tax=Micromonospora cabrerizensis TaxID=2911213 RepID=UPI001EE79F27|nr:dienelactone hydrolase family protein [Micromonospora cabrerizensis]MCG5473236.1 dienelactone hydrolase family protein [Micromonospora cabrerizensis]
MTTPVAQRPFVLSTPAAPVERHGTVDLHLPSRADPAPAVVVVHGAPLPPDAPDPRDWLLYRGYGALLADSGVVTAVISYQVTDLTALPAAADDIAAMVEQVRADPRVDPERVVLWFFSGGGLFAADWLRAAPPWLRGIALTYPLLVPFPGWEVDTRFLPVDALDSGAHVPLVLTRAGRDIPPVLAGIDAFLPAATAHGWPIRVIEVPDGQHSFDILDHTPQSEAAAITARDAVLDLLKAT